MTEIMPTIVGGGAALMLVIIAGVFLLSYLDR